MKLCTKCGKTKENTEFFKCNSFPSGLQYYCKDCLKSYYKKNRNKKLLYQKEYKKKNREKILEYNKRRPINKEKVKELSRKYYAQNLDKERERGREKARRCRPRMMEYAIRWRKNNPDKWKEIIKRRHLKKLSSLRGKLENRIHSGIYQSLRKGTKNRQRWELLVGYTVDQLKTHLEKKFTDGMSWNNIGKWHIDHIIPISAFNFEKPEDIDFKKCWALSNLQPMWAKNNIKKFNKLDKPFQPSLQMAI